MHQNDRVAYNNSDSHPTTNTVKKGATGGVTKPDYPQPPPIIPSSLSAAEEGGAKINFPQHQHFQFVPNVPNKTPQEENKNDDHQKQKQMQISTSNSSTIPTNPHHHPNANVLVPSFSPRRRQPMQQQLVVVGSSGGLVSEGNTTSRKPQTNAVAEVSEGQKQIQQHDPSSSNSIQRNTEKEQSQEQRQDPSSAVNEQIEVAHFFSVHPSQTEQVSHEERQGGKEKEAEPSKVTAKGGAVDYLTLQLHETQKKVLEVLERTSPIVKEFSTIGVVVLKDGQRPEVSNPLVIEKSISIPIPPAPVASSILQPLNPPTTRQQDSSTHGNNKTAPTKNVADQKSTISQHQKIVHQQDQHFLQEQQEMQLLPTGGPVPPPSDQVLFSSTTADPLVTLRECIKHFISHSQRFGPVHQLLVQECNYVISMWCGDPTALSDRKQLLRQRNNQNTNNNSNIGGASQTRPGHWRQELQRKSQEEKDVFSLEPLVIEENYFDKLSIAWKSKKNQEEMQRRKLLMAKELKLRDGGKKNRKIIRTKSTSSSSTGGSSVSSSLHEEDTAHRKVQQATATTTTTTSSIKNNTSPNNHDQSSSTTAEQKEMLSMMMREGGGNNSKSEETTTRRVDENDNHNKKEQGGGEVTHQHHQKRKKHHHHHHTIDSFSFGKDPEEEDGHNDNNQGQEFMFFAPEDPTTTREIELLRKKVRRQETVNDHLRGHLESMNVDLLSIHDQNKTLTTQITEAEYNDTMFKKEILKLQEKIAMLRKELGEIHHHKTKEAQMKEANENSNERKLAESKNEILQLYKHLRNAEHQNLILEREIGNAHLDRDEFETKFFKILSANESMAEKLNEKDEEIIEMRDQMSKQNQSVEMLEEQAKELEVLAGFGSIPDKLMAEHPMWSLYFFILRQHRLSVSLYCPLLVSHFLLMNSNSAAGGMMMMSGGKKIQQSPQNFGIPTSGGNGLQLLSSSLTTPSYSPFVGNCSSALLSAMMAFLVSSAARGIYQPLVLNTAAQRIAQQRNGGGMEPSPPVVITNTNNPAVGAQISSAQPPPSSFPQGKATQQQSTSQSSSSSFGLNVHSLPIPNQFSTLFYFKLYQLLHMTNPRDFKMLEAECEMVCWDDEGEGREKVIVEGGLNNRAQETTEQQVEGEKMNKKSEEGKLEGEQRKKSEKQDDDFPNEKKEVISTPGYIYTYQNPQRDMLMMMMEQGIQHTTSNSNKGGGGTKGMKSSSSSSAQLPTSLEEYFLHFDVLDEFSCKHKNSTAATENHRRQLTEGKEDIKAKEGDKNENPKKSKNDVVSCHSLFSCRFQVKSISQTSAASASSPLENPSRSPQGQSPTSRLPTKAQKWQQDHPQENYVCLQHQNPIYQSVYCEVLPSSSSSCSPQQGVGSGFIFPEFSSIAPSADMEAPQPPSSKEVEGVGLLHWKYRRNMRERRAGKTASASSPPNGGDGGKISGGHPIFFKPSRAVTPTTTTATTSKNFPTEAADFSLSPPPFFPSDSSCFVHRPENFLERGENTTFFLRINLHDIEVKKQHKSEEGMSSNCQIPFGNSKEEVSVGEGNQQPQFFVVENEKEMIADHNRRMLAMRELQLEKLTENHEVLMSVFPETILSLLSPVSFSTPCSSVAPSVIAFLKEIGTMIQDVMSNPSGSKSNGNRNPGGKAAKSQNTTTATKKNNNLANKKKVLSSSRAYNNNIGSSSSDSEDEDIEGRTEQEEEGKICQEFLQKIMGGRRSFLSSCFGFRTAPQLQEVLVRWIRQLHPNGGGGSNAKKSTTTTTSMPTSTSASSSPLLSLHFSCHMLNGLALPKPQFLKNISVGIGPSSHAGVAAVGSDHASSPSQIVSLHLTKNEILNVLRSFWDYRYQQYTSYVSAQRQVQLLELRLYELMEELESYKRSRKDVIQAQRKAEKRKEKRLKQQQEEEEAKKLAAVEKEKLEKKEKKAAEVNALLLGKKTKQQSNSSRSQKEKEESEGKSEEKELSGDEEEEEADEGLPLEHGDDGRSAGSSSFSTSSDESSGGEAIKPNNHGGKEKRSTTKKQKGTTAQEMKKEKGETEVAKRGDATGRETEKENRSPQYPSIATILEQDPQVITAEQEITALEQILSQLLNKKRKVIFRIFSKVPFSGVEQNVQGGGSQQQIGKDGSGQQNSGKKSTQPQQPSETLQQDNSADSCPTTTTTTEINQENVTFSIPPLQRYPTCVEALHAFLAMKFPTKAQAHQQAKQLKKFSSSCNAACSSAPTTASTSTSTSITLNNNTMGEEGGGLKNFLGTSSRLQDSAHHDNDNLDDDMNEMGAPSSSSSSSSSVYLHQHQQKLMKRMKNEKIRNNKNRIKTNNNHGRSSGYQHLSPEDESELCHAAMEVSVLHDQSQLQHLFFMKSLASLFLHPNGITSMGNMLGGGGGSVNALMEEFLSGSDSNHEELGADNIPVSSTSPPGAPLRGSKATTTTTNAASKAAPKKRSNAAGSGQAELVQNLTQAQLSPTALEYLQSIFMFCNECQTTDPELQMFFLVFHQLMPEQFAFDFYQNLEELRLKCDEKYTDALVFSNGLVGSRVAAPSISKLEKINKNATLSQDDQDGNTSPKDVDISPHANKPQQPRVALTSLVSKKEQEITAEEALKRMQENEDEEIERMFVEGGDNGSIPLRRYALAGQASPVKLKFRKSVLTHHSASTIGPALLLGDAKRPPMVRAGGGEGGSSNILKATTLAITATNALQQRTTVSPMSPRQLSTSIAPPTSSTKGNLFSNASFGGLERNTSSTITSSFFPVPGGVGEDHLSANQQQNSYSADPSSLYQRQTGRMEISQFTDLLESQCFTVYGAPITPNVDLPTPWVEEIVSLQQKEKRSADWISNFLATTNGNLGGSANEKDALSVAQRRSLHRHASIVSDGTGFTGIGVRTKLQDLFLNDALRPFSNLPTSTTTTANANAATSINVHSSSPNYFTSSGKGGNRSIPSEGPSSNGGGKSVRWIPNPPTIQNLFRFSVGVNTDGDFEERNNNAVNPTTTGESDSSQNSSRNISLLFPKQTQKVLLTSLELSRLKFALSVDQQTAVASGTSSVPSTSFSSSSSLDYAKLLSGSSASNCFTSELLNIFLGNFLSHQREILNAMEAATETMEVEVAFFPHPQTTRKKNKKKRQNRSQDSSAEREEFENSSSSSTDSDDNDTSAQSRSISPTSSSTSMTTSNKKQRYSHNVATASTLTSVVNIAKFEAEWLKRDPGRYHDIHYLVSLLTSSSSTTPPQSTNVADQDGGVVHSDQKNTVTHHNEKTETQGSSIHQKRREGETEGGKQEDASFLPPQRRQRDARLHCPFSVPTYDMGMADCLQLQRSRSRGGNSQHVFFHQNEKANHHQETSILDSAACRPLETHFHTQWRDILPYGDPNFLSFKRLLIRHGSYTSQAHESGEGGGNKTKNGRGDDPKIKLTTGVDDTTTNSYLKSENKDPDSCCKAVGNYISKSVLEARIRKLYLHRASDVVLLPTLAMRRHYLPLYQRLKKSSASMAATNATSVTCSPSEKQLPLPFCILLPPISAISLLTFRDSALMEVSSSSFVRHHSELMPTSLSNVPPLENATPTAKTSGKGEKTLHHGDPKAKDQRHDVQKTTTEEAEEASKQSPTFQLQFQRKRFLQLKKRLQLEIHQSQVNGFKHWCQSAALGSEIRKQDMLSGMGDEMLARKEKPHFEKDEQQQGDGNVLKNIDDKKVQGKQNELSTTNTMNPLHGIGQWLVARSLTTSPLSTVSMQELLPPCLQDPMLAYLIPLSYFPLLCEMSMATNTSSESPRSYHQHSSSSLHDEGSSNNVVVASTANDNDDDGGVTDMLCKVLFDVVAPHPLLGGTATAMEGGYGQQQTWNESSINNNPSVKLERRLSRKGTTSNMFSSSSPGQQGQQLTWRAAQQKRKQEIKNWVNLIYRSSALQQSPPPGNNSTAGANPTMYYSARAALIQLLHQPSHLSSSGTNRGGAAVFDPFSLLFLLTGDLFVSSANLSSSFSSSPFSHTNSALGVTKQPRSGSSILPVGVEVSTNRMAEVLLSVNNAISFTTIGANMTTAATSSATALHVYNPVVTLARFVKYAHVLHPHFGGSTGTGHSSSSLSCSLAAILCQYIVSLRENMTAQSLMTSQLLQIYCISYDDTMNWVWVKRKECEQRNLLISSTMSPSSGVFEPDSTGEQPGREEKEQLPVTEKEKSTEGGEPGSPSSRYQAQKVAEKQQRLNEIAQGEIQRQLDDLEELLIGMRNRGLLGMHYRVVATNSTQ